MPDTNNALHEVHANRWQAGHLPGLPYLAEQIASGCQGWGQAGHLPGLLFTLQSTGDARKPYSRYPYLYSTTHLHLDRGGHNYLKKLTLNAKTLKIIKSPKK